MKKTLIYDKIQKVKVNFDGNSRFDVLYERHSDEWIVIDTCLFKPKSEKDAMKTANAMFFNWKESAYK